MDNEDRSVEEQLEILARASSKLIDEIDTLKISALVTQFTLVDIAARSGIEQADFEKMIRTNLKLAMKMEHPEVDPSEVDEAAASLKADAAIAKARRATDVH